MISSNLKSDSQGEWYITCRVYRARTIMLPALDSNLLWRSFDPYGNPYDPILCKKSWPARR